MANKNKTKAAKETVTAEDMPVEAPEAEDIPRDGTAYDGVHTVSAEEYWGENNENNPSEPSHP